MFIIGIIAILVHWGTAKPALSAFTAFNFRVVNKSALMVYLSLIPAGADTTLVTVCHYLEQHSRGGDRFLPLEEYASYSFL